MRRRILATTVGAAALAMVLLGLPLSVAVRGLLANQALAALQQQAEQVQVVLNQQRLSLIDRRELLEEYAAATGVRFVLFDRFGSVGVSIDTGAPPEVPEGLDDDLAQALDGRAGRVRGEGILAVSVPVRVGGVTQIVRAVQTDEALAAEIRKAMLAIGGLGLTALSIAALVATWLSRRLAEPLEDLAAAAIRIGEGDFSARAPHSGIPESDQVATALDVTADRLGLLVERSRSFSADASHQLRTPLTALRLDLEALEVAGADPTLLAAAFNEADRLEATIEELLTLADMPGGDEYLQLATLAEERLDAWTALARAEGRQVRLEADPVPLVRARSAAVGQCLQVLLDNALEHGEGTITVRVSSMSPPTGGERGWVRLCVSDEGPGFADDSEPGRGLRLARSLIQAEGGRIKIERPATVCLLLPSVPADQAALVGQQ